MRKVLILLLALCAFTTGMGLREKRALNTEEEQLTKALASSTKPANSREICQPHTPCAWSLYKNLNNIKVVETLVTNNYCICGPNTECLISDQDPSANVAVHRCRKPGSPENIDFQTT